MCSMLELVLKYNIWLKESIVTPVSARYDQRKDDLNSFIIPPYAMILEEKLSSIRTFKD